MNVQINGVFRSVAFSGKKSENEQKSSPKLGSNRYNFRYEVGDSFRTFPYRPLPKELQESLDNFIEHSKPKPEIIADSVNTNEEIAADVEFSAKRSPKDLNMDEILSIETPNVESKAKIPFELGDKYFKLDKYQKQAINAFINGKTTVVTAPTGTGKTLIAEYGIKDTLEKGKKIIYLSPLKALSNEKFTKFSELFGNYDSKYEYMNNQNVGIITGDISIHPDAQLLVMTTEIYRNMLINDTEENIAEKLKDFDAVIYDEFHYMADPDRGKVWEESVMNTPKHMKQMMLSATASNAKEVSDWIAKLNPAKEVELVNVPETERHVPLKEFVFGFDFSSGPKLQQLTSHKIILSDLNGSLSDRQKLALEDISNLVGEQHPVEYIKGLQDIIEDGEIDADEFAQKLQEKGVNSDKATQLALILSDKRKATFKDCSKLVYPEKGPKINSLIRILDKENKTPALFFVFSKKRCQEYIENASRRVGTLLTPEQSKEVLDRVNEAKEKGIYLGKDFDDKCLDGLMKGYAIHHAGMLPAYKSLVEGLAREGLVKVCFATETLIAGINMPFKTVVLTSLEKSNGVSNIILPNSTFKQGIGRSGRRGIDEIGNVIMMPKGNADLNNFTTLLKSTDTSIKSQFNSTYSSLLAPNMMKNMEKTLTKTFAYFQKNGKNNILEESVKKRDYLLKKGYIVKNESKSYEPTEKGLIARKIFGINEIVMTELLTDTKYTDKMTPAELAALITIFADVKDNNPKTTFPAEFDDFAKKATKAIDMAKGIKAEQYANKIYDRLPMSTNLATGILRFAETDIDTENPKKLWMDTIDDLRNKHLITYEGDLLRVINGTIDLLRNLAEVTESEDLRIKAEQAIELLKKPPVTDILKYELDIQ